MAARTTRTKKKTTKAKAPVVRATVKRKTVTTKKKLKSKPRTKRKVVSAATIQPIVTSTPVAPSLSIPTVTPASPLTLHEGYKHVAAAPVARGKLWLTVGLSMAVIVCIWAYALSQSIFSSRALEISSDQIQLGNFVESLGTDLSDLKSNTDTFIDQTDQLNTNTNTNTNIETPSNAALDNLFSDIQ